jgi:dihydrofolate reductase
MDYEMIVAIDENNGIGFGNKIPWKVPEDMKFFKFKTEYNVIIMGYNTFDSLENPLPNRLNIVLTQKKCISCKNNLIFINNIEDIKNIDFTKYDFLKKDFTKFIIGGKIIYELFFDKCNTFWITLIKGKYMTDTNISNIIIKINDLQLYSQIVKNSNIFSIFMYKKLK